MASEATPRRSLGARAARLATAALPYTWPIRIGLGVMFLFSSAPKIRDLSGFAGVVQQYAILPEPLVVPFAYAMPFGEFLLGVLLTLGFLTRLAALGGAGLMLLFIAALVYNLLRGNTPECGCFELGGASGSIIDWSLVARDVLFLGLFAVTFFDRTRRFSLDRWIGGGTERG
jgi:uncharacterized membrane protein YphA (DoxX/SURF4 family)